MSGPRTFGEWMFLACILSFAAFKYATIMLSLVIIIFASVSGMRDGFDIVIISLLSLFGFLLAIDAVNLFLSEPADMLNSAGINVFGTIAHLIWVVFGGLLLHGFLTNAPWPRDSVHWLYVGIASGILITNVPLVIFRAALCFERFRKHGKRVYEDLAVFVRSQEKFEQQEKNP